MTCHSVTCDFIKVNVSNCKNDSVAFEVKFPKDILIGQLKSKLEIITGGSASTMKIELYDGDRLIGLLERNDSQLQSYPIENGMRLHIVDSFTSIDEENVLKFELTDEQYSKKDGTVRNFLKINQLGKYNTEEMKERETKRQEQYQEIQKRAKLCTVGSRCKVTVANNPTRVGTIRYNGPLIGKNGIFIGIEYDEPLGKNNGSVNGKVYFTCPQNYGGFVSPLAVEMGDFPPAEYGIDDEI